MTGEVSGHMLEVVGGSSSSRAQRAASVFRRNRAGVVRRRRRRSIWVGPIVCLGEWLDEPEGNRTEDVLGEQFDGGLAPLTGEQFAKVTIA